MILIRITTDNDTYYISKQGIEAGDQYWREELKSFSSPQYNLGTVYGGHCKMTFGKMTILPNAMTHANDFPPPRQITVDVQRYLSSTGATTTLFSGLNGYRRDLKPDETQYDIFDRAFDVKVLDEGPGYDPDSYPIVDSTYFQWTASGDGTNEYYCEAKGGGDPEILPGVEKIILDYTSELTKGEAGSLATNEWDYTDNDSLGYLTVYVRLAASPYDPDIRANGYLQVGYKSGTEAYPRAFGYVTHVAPKRLPDAAYGRPKYHKGDLVGTEFNCEDKGVWCIYDDGLPIPENLGVVDTDSFTLATYAVGELTMTGHSTKITLGQIITWATGASYLNLSYDIALASVVTVSHWQTSQQNLLDFLNNILSFYCHLGYISEDTYYLVDMDSANGATVTSNVVDFKISNDAPISQFTSKWTTKRSGTWLVTGGSNDVQVFLKDIDNEAVVTTDYPYGSEKNINPYNDDYDTVLAQLESIKVFSLAYRGDVTLPMGDVLPKPGYRVVFIDDRYKREITCVVAARKITYDFDQNKIVLSGDASISTNTNILLLDGSLLITSDDDTFLI